MKKFIVSVAGLAVLLAACANPFAKPETPTEALAAASQKTSQLHSAKFDISGRVEIKLPPQLLQTLSQSGAQLPPGLSTGGYSVDLKGSGEALLPDRLHLALTARLGGLTITTEEVVAGGKVYARNPFTGKWTEATASQGGLATGFNQPDPLSYTQLLGSVQSIQDLGDTQLGGVTVRHYRLQLDKAKLNAELESRLRNPQAAAAVKQILSSGTLLIEAWFGKDDHLVRRISSDTDVTVDLAQLFSTLGAGSGAVPSDSSVHVSGHLVMDYHDFNAPVTITVPQVG